MMVYIAAHVHISKGSVKINITRSALLKKILIGNRDKWGDVFIEVNVLCLAI